MCINVLYCTEWSCLPPTNQLFLFEDLHDGEASFTHRLLETVGTLFALAGGRCGGLSATVGALQADPLHHNKVF